MMLNTRPHIGSENSESRFYDRELSWLAFNERVLLQACLQDNPAGEKLRFISIAAHNLDEFFMVRLAGIYHLKRRDYHRIPETDERVDDLLSKIEETIRYLLILQQQIENDVLGLLADQHAIKIIESESLEKKEMKWLEQWYEENLLPLLSPTTIDPRHPFPFIHNRGQGLLIEMVQDKDKPQKVVILLPANIPRFIALPGAEMRFVRAENAIMTFLSRIYPGFNIKHSGMFRLLRDSEVEIDDEAADLVSQFETALQKRRRGNAVSLIVSDSLSKTLLNFLKTQLGLSDSQVFQTAGLIGSGDFSEIVRMLPASCLYPEYKPRFPQRILDFKGDCFAAIQNKDIIIHHPYESFDVVVRFLQQAAHDPDVLAIRQTLYRTTPHSPIAKALIEAAENGKSVTALIELKARFDEENNIQLARALERAGAQVAYGLADLKIHSKLTHITRRENDRLKAYVHCGTGNYHPLTAKIYTDLSFFTCDSAICQDVWRIFNFLTSHVAPEKLNKLVISPYSSFQWLNERIDVEIAHAKDGRPARIWMKTNAVVDRAIIERLYEASQAGVQIDLCVRGMCCLRPQIPGLSENIRVWSIIGRFLEHGRIYAFANGDVFGKASTQVYIASADLMPRNLYRRVEVFVPLENETVRKQMMSQVIEALNADRKNRWVLRPDGSYEKAKNPDEKLLSAHEYFMQNPSLSGQGSLAIASAE